MPNFLSGGTDFTATFVPKSYLLDRYPEIVNSYRQAGLWSWGYNPNGEIGDGASVTTYNSPIQTISGGINWKYVGTSHYFSVAIKTDGTLWSWGLNNNGQMGTNSVVTTKYSSPVQTVAGGTNWRLVSGGYAHVAAVKTDGTLWLWGRNAYGQLGDNTIVSKSSPVQITGGGTNWKQPSCAFGHTFSIKTDGTLWGWGKNNLSELGLTLDNNPRSVPTLITGGGFTWKQVSAGTGGSGGIKTDGTLWMWGSNAYGALGRNNTTQTNSPAQTSVGGNNWKQISCSAGQTKFSTAAIKTDGTLWTWGDNSFSQLGDGTTINKSTPSQTVAGGTNWYQVSVNQYTSGAIKTDGTLWMWGYGNIGALGDGTTITKSSPVLIGSGANWKYIKAGYHAIAIRDDAYDPGIGTL
jgi:alpha-tubulin suppressor-like RCC1 family protein